MKVLKNLDKIKINFQNMKKNHLTNILTIIGVIILSVYFWGSATFNRVQTLAITPESSLEAISKQLETIRNLLNDRITNDNLNQISNQEPFKNQEQALNVPNVVQSYEEQIIKVVENSNDSVVSIIITKDLPVIERYYTNPFGDFDIPGFEFYFNFPQYRQNGTQKREIGGGSGFVVSSNGYIVTNKHVVNDSTAEYTVLLNNGQKLPAKVVGKDPVLDVAVIKVEANNLKPLPLGDSSNLKLGQSAIAIGNALGEFKNTVSVGVISGLSRTVQAQGEILTDVIQTDAAINQGNSGGPLLNLKGEVIGINTAVALGAENIGFAIPINQVKGVINQVVQTGRISTAYENVKNDLNLTVDYGALVVMGDTGWAVEPNSPADKAGIKQGDIILEINGEKITADNPLNIVLKKYTPGTMVNIKVLRNNEVLNLNAVLKERTN